ncbi:MAG: DinB family protein [Bryobacteraceae bacterium]
MVSANRLTNAKVFRPAGTVGFDPKLFREAVKLMTEKESFLGNHARESQTTLNLLKAFPSDKLDFRPHPKARSARELAFVLANQELFFKQAAEGVFDPSLLGNQPPQTMAGIVELLERNSKAVDQAVQALTVEQHNKTVNFFGHDMRRMDAIWANMYDLVHHRGQFSVYVRMSDAAVPSIYGPTADTQSKSASQ